MATNSNSRAVKIAQVHFEDDFSSRWGVEELMAENAFYIFNNMPYRGNYSQPAIASGTKFVDN